MSENFNIEGIKIAFDEAKIMLKENQIDLLEYRTLINSLYLEIKELEKKRNNEDIRDILNSLINKERSKNNISKEKDI